MTSLRRRFAAAVVFLCAAGAALAQGYPAKTIRVVVGFPPGGGNDLIARLVGAKLQEAWGQPVVIENKPGASSIIAAEYVAKAAPDGYTLLVNATGGMSVNPAIYAKLPYDSLTDFAPITIIGTFPLVLVVHPSVPATSVRELVAHLKANPGKLNYSSAASAFQVAAEMFKQMTGTDVRNIPYKGSAASIQAVIAGEVQMAFVDTPPLLPQMRAGKLRGLAVTSTKRDPSVPELPTLAESGVPGYEMMLWIGMFAPAATPRDITAKLNAEVVRIVQSPEVRERLAGMGVDPLGNTPQEMHDWIRSEITKFIPVAKAGNIKAE